MIFVRLLVIILVSLLISVGICSLSQTDVQRLGMLDLQLRSKESRSQNLAPQALKGLESTCENQLQNTASCLRSRTRMDVDTTELELSETLRFLCKGYGEAPFSLELTQVPFGLLSFNHADQYIFTSSLIEEYQKNGAPKIGMRFVAQMTNGIYTLGQESNRFGRADTE